MSLGSAKRFRFYELFPLSLVINVISLRRQPRPIVPFIDRGREKTFLASPRRHCVWLMARLICAKRLQWELNDATALLVLELERENPRRKLNYVM
jgi:hypothetical protein